MPPSEPALKPVTGKDVLHRYSGLTPGARLFLSLRWLWTPYVEMASELPARGRILDGGCGHGLLSLALGLQSPARKVLGLDHAEERVEAGTAAARGIPGLRFQKGDYRKPPPGPFDGIALIDCLHYLTYDEQAKVLAACRKRLRRGGVLLFREVDRKPGFASAFNRFHEAVMTGLGFTKAEGLHFRSAGGWVRFAKEAGFQVESRPCARFPFADHLVRCRKP